MTLPVAYTVPRFEAVKAAANAAGEQHVCTYTFIVGTLGVKFP